MQKKDFEKKRIEKRVEDAKSAFKKEDPKAKAKNKAAAKKAKFEKV